jgi:ASCH domain
MKKPTKALSIRQPWAELILRGTKRVEFRSMRTHIRERVYVYASLTPGDEEAFNKLGLAVGELPTGLIVGTVEIVGCSGRKGSRRWHLARPERAKRLIKPKRKPQPVWLIPF